MRRTQDVSGVVGDTSMESGDWRSQVQADIRPRLINKIMDTLKSNFAFSGHDQELKKIAVRLEEEIYTAATSQNDYLLKIGVKILTMETRSYNPMPDILQFNSGSQVMQQANSQQQPLYILLPSNHPEPWSRTIIIPSFEMQGSSSLSSTLPPGTGLPQSTILNAASQNPSLQNIQNMTRAQQHSVGNTMGSNNFANQTQIPGRQQQQLAPQQQQQQLQRQTQNSHYAYQQKLQQIAKQKLQVQQGNIPPSMQQIQQQQQNLLQQSVMQPTMILSVQNQQSVVQASLDSTAHMDNAHGGDWPEEVFQKIEDDLYLLDLNENHQKSS